MSVASNYALGSHFIRLLHPDGTEIRKYAVSDGEPRRDSGLILLKELVPPTFALTAATDVVVTASLVYYLQIRKTGVQGYASSFRTTRLGYWTSLMLMYTPQHEWARQPTHLYDSEERSH